MISFSEEMSKRYQSVDNIIIKQSVLLYCRIEAKLSRADITDFILFFES